jgi:hypothetical protein
MVIRRPDSGQLSCKWYNGCPDPGICGNLSDLGCGKGNNFVSLQKNVRDMAGPGPRPYTFTMKIFS